jgi:predicted transcriptional regulator
MAPTRARDKVRERHLAFPDLSAMLHVLSPKRLELRRAVHETPTSSVKALAERLGRDYKRAHEDVGTLTASGFLRRENGSMSAPYDAITAEMRL